MIHGYWGIRGVGQVPRLCLAISGHEWKDQKYVEKEQWFDKDKKQLGLDFPNLPYLIDGDFKLTESTAIIRYILSTAPKQEGKDALGKNPKDEAMVLAIDGVIMDGVKDLVILFWNPKWEELLPPAKEKAVVKSEYLNKFYGERQFATGYLTVADIKVAEISYYIEKIIPDVYEKHPFWKRTRDAVNNFPSIKAYYESENAVKGPFVGPTGVIQF